VCDVFVAIPTECNYKYVCTFAFTCIYGSCMYVCTDGICMVQHIAHAVIVFVFVWCVCLTFCVCV